MSQQEAWLDVALIRCPHCERYYADASWYVSEIGSDIECGSCHRNFNTKRHIVDRLMLKFSIDENERAKDVEIQRHLQLQ